MHLFFTPAAPHGSGAHVAHGAFPDADQVEPATHATWHTVSDVLVQSVFTPAAHTESAAQVSHGAVPAVENVDPATQATWHTVSVVLEQAVFKPAVHVEEAAHVEHGAVPAVENVDPATQGAGFLQQAASLGLVALDLLLSYTRDPRHAASANAAPPRLVVSPHVGTKAGAGVVNEADVTVLGMVTPLP